MTEKKTLAQNGDIQAQEEEKPVEQAGIRADEERYRDPGASPDVRARDLLARMTWEEKLAQLVGYNEAVWSADDFDRDYPLGAGQVSFFGGMEKQDICEAARWQRELQERIMERSRFRIPALFHVETLCGVMLPQATSLPSGIGQAATFDPEHQERVMRMVGRQARAAGATQGFSPVLDVSRDSRFGRQGETGGEDPTLIAAMGCASVRGLQQDGEFAHGVLATAKHFLGYHGAQGGIHAAACDIPERLLREVYAKPFQAAVTEADMRGIMPCYGSVNGEPVSGSGQILRGLLREEMGFDGLTVSDYCAVQEICERQCAAESLAEAGKRALLAGMQQELPSGNCFLPETLEVYRDEAAVCQAVDEAVAEILEEKFRVGLFENPYAAAEDELRELYGRPENQELTYRSALESLVLVKNDGVLPLKRRAQKIAVIGYHAGATRALYGGYTYMSMTESVLGAKTTMAGVGQPDSKKVPSTAWIDGKEKAKPDDKRMAQCAAQADDGKNMQSGGNPAVWSGSIVEREHPDAERLAKELAPGGKNLLEALRETGGEVSFTYTFGYPYAGDDCSGHEEALAAAREADLLLLTVGGKYGTGTTASMGEGIDGTDINLPCCQERLIEKLAGLGKPMVLVHFGGRPISSDAADQYADAILEAWNPGEKGAEAIAHTLFGDYNPAGRMPVTTAYCAGQIPVYYNHPNGSSYHQGTVSAFRQYVDCPHEPRYYFGHGLSYTQFDYSNLRVSMKDADTIAKEDSGSAEKSRGAFGAEGKKGSREVGREPVAVGKEAGGESAVTGKEAGGEPTVAGKETGGEPAVRIELEIQNTGGMDGDEVVQLYVRDERASMVRPVMELAGFRRIHLRQGEKKSVAFVMRLSQLAFLDQEMRWKVEAGRFEVLVGASAKDIRLRGEFTVEESFWVDGKKRGFFAETIV